MNKDAIKRQIADLTDGFEPSKMRGNLNYVFNGRANSVGGFSPVLFGDGTKSSFNIEKGVTTTLTTPLPSNSEIVLIFVDNNYPSWPIPATLKLNRSKALEARVIYEPSNPAELKFE